MNVKFRVALAGALLLMAASCSTDEEIGLEPLVCPAAGVLSDAASLRVFGDGEFMRVHLLECALENGEMKAAIRYEARAKPGPAATQNAYEYQYFVTLLAPDGTILSKTIQRSTAKFKSDRAEIFFAEEYDDIEFTVPEDADGLGYEILIGFQLTREQMEYNRARRASPAARTFPDVETR
ncbi:MAG: hypothetical protein ACOY2B_08465 [Pseudomonadota bacterium]